MALKISSCVEFLEAIQSKLNVLGSGVVSRMMEEGLASSILTLTALPSLISFELKGLILTHT